MIPYKQEKPIFTKFFDFDKLQNLHVGVVVDYTYSVSAYVFSTRTRYQRSRLIRWHDVHEVIASADYLETCPHSCWLTNKVDKLQKTLKKYKKVVKQTKKKNAVDKLLLRVVVE